MRPWSTMPTRWYIRHTVWASLMLQINTSGPSIATAKYESMWSHPVGKSGQSHVCFAFLQNGSVNMSARFWGIVAHVRNGFYGCRFMLLVVSILKLKTVHHTGDSVQEISWSSRENISTAVPRRYLHTPPQVRSGPITFFGHNQR